MPERDLCYICLREQATEEDWETNSQLPSWREREADRLGLNDLCWDKEGDDCLSRAIELGRPLSYGEAMTRIADLEHAIEEHRDILDQEALGPRQLDRDDVDNALYRNLAQGENK